jgi:hypothetical protein
VSATHRLAAATLAVALALGVSAAGAAEAPTAFKIYVEQPGAYAVSFADLAAAGLAADDLPSGDLAVTLGGESVPIWVADGGDGRFGPGDRFELLGEHLAGEITYWNERSRYNVYRLRTDGAGAARMVARPASDDPADGTPLLREWRHEEDALFIRPPARPGETHELWFWAKIVGGYEPVQVPLELPGLDRQSGRGVALRVGLRGWSRPRTKGSEELPDHRVDLLLNGRPLAEAGWDGTGLHVVELPDVPAGHFLAGANVLTLASPGRRQADGRQMVDVVLLDWIELVAPHDGRVGDEQLTLHGAEPAAVHLQADGEGELLVYGAAGWRAAAGSDTGLVVEAGADRLVATRDARLRSPDAVVADRPSTLRDAAQQADYLMIAHRDLLAAVEPLAHFHRRRGLKVEVVDVEDVYDEFSHGVRDPLAIRDFLAYAHASWRPPAPRFVLLVGDASWDTRNERAVDENYADWEHRPNERARFVKNDSTPYAGDAGLNHRNLVPTLSFDNRFGHAASDNLFVAFADDGEKADWLPAMAIGRFPVAEPEEVAAIVEKSIRYATAPEAGDWARQVLFISNDQPSFQKRSNQVADEVEAKGFRAVKIYPQADEPSNQAHTAELMSALDDGALFVHFYGHGGRYIWRTGPPDLEKNHDLLTLDHLDALAPSARLPVVLSLTCYSAPFDHPSADSIGEKLLRLEGRGAIAVVAASWRNSPRVSWGKTLFEELTAPGATIGEALMRAKRRERNRFFVNSYNLLGDPALPVAAIATGPTAAHGVAEMDD